MRRTYLVIVFLLLLVGNSSSQQQILTKTPYELFDVSMDFQARAANGITIDSVNATLNSTGQDVTSSLIVNTPDTPVPFVPTATNKVIFRVKGGVAGATYNLAVHVVKQDTGEKLEGDIPLRVVAGQNPQ